MKARRRRGFQWRRLGGQPSYTLKSEAEAEVGSRQPSWRVEDVVCREGPPRGSLDHRVRGQDGAGLPQMAVQAVPCTGGLEEAVSGANLSRHILGPGARQPLPRGVKTSTI